MPRLMDVSRAQTFCGKMMKKQLNTFLLSLLTLGFGYLLVGDRKSFYKTILVFFTILIFGAASRWFTSFWGLSAIVFVLTIIYAFAAIHATMKTKVTNTQTKFTWILNNGAVNGNQLINQQVIDTLFVKRSNVLALRLAH
jgi:hypothetical protein